MFARSRGVGWRIAMLFVSLLTPAALIAGTPGAAAAEAATGHCSPHANSPRLWTDGWAIYMEGSGFANCTGPADVEMLLKEHKSFIPDPTLAAAYGREGDFLRASAPCWHAGNDANYYVEVRAHIDGEEFKVQSDWVRVNADCG
jgi:hypothetical protein